MKNWRSFTGILRSTILALIMLGLVSMGSFEGLERATLFMRLQWRGPRPVSPSVLVIAIDEPSLAQWGQFPWDRRVYGKLLERLGQAKAVAFDIAFNEPGRHPGEDEELARKMLKKPVILPIYRAYGSGESDHVELQVPLSLYRKSAQALGIIQFSPRQESPLLAFHPVQHQNQAVFPSMALAMARLGGHGSSEPFYLNYPGPARSYPIMSFKEALSLPLETFKNKYILVGATAAGLPDTGYQTPFPEKGPIAGVELHAIALGNLLEGNGIKRLPPFLDFLLFLGIAGLGSLLYRPRVPSPWLRVAGWLGGSIAWLLLAQGFLHLNWWLELVPVLFFWGACFLVGMVREELALIQDRNRWLEWYTEELQRESQKQRARIDGELHDEAQQLVIALLRDLRRAPKLFEKFEKSPEKLLEKLGDLAGIAEKVLAEIIRVRRDLIPPALAQGGFLAAIEEMLTVASQRGGFQTELLVENWDGVPQPLEHELYWLVKECLNNTIKHAAAEHVRLSLVRAQDTLSVLVADDGRGFPVPDLTLPPKGTEKSGLHRLSMRAHALGGHLEIASCPQGSRFHFHLPLKNGGHA